MSWFYGLNVSIFGEVLISLTTAEVQRERERIRWWRQSLFPENVNAPSALLLPWSEPHVFHRSRICYFSLEWEKGMTRSNMKKQQLVLTCGLSWYFVFFLFLPCLCLLACFLSTRHMLESFGKGNFNWEPSPIRQDYEWCHSWARDPGYQEEQAEQARSKAESSTPPRPLRSKLNF